MFFLHSLPFFGLFFSFDSTVGGFFLNEPFGRPRGRFGPEGLETVSFFFADFEPLGRPLPLLTTGSSDSSAAGAGAFGGRPRFFAELAAASTSGILVTCSFSTLYWGILK